MVQNIEDLLHATEKCWLEFFTLRPDLLPKAYLLGDLVTRVHSFVQDISKVLFVQPNLQTTKSSTASTVPSLTTTFESDILAHFFHSDGIFSFSDDFDTSKLEKVRSAALGLFSGDNRVASFIASAVRELWVLYKLTKLTGTMYSFSD